MEHNSPHLKSCLAILLLFSVSVIGLHGHAQPKTIDKDNVVAQMNYCMNTLTNIVHNKSIDVLEHETDQLINNLTMEQIVGLEDIKDFRIDLLDAVSKFEITEEERAIIRRVQSMMNDKRKWAAVSNALSSTMLLFPGGVSGKGGVGMQVAFQALLTTARTVVEYKASGYDQNAEELQAMWELRKEDMKNINELRKQAHSIIYNLYEKYGLNENDRLTENTANLLNEYVTEPNVAKRIRLLEDNRAVYVNLTDYYYFLGMAYVDANDYTKARPLFDEYIARYTKTPILRYNEKLGTIALAKLTYEKHLSDSQKKDLVQTALKNLPGNSAATLQCALIYINDFKDWSKGFDLIRLGIDDPRATDVNLLASAASNLVPHFKKDKNRREAMKNAVESRLPINWGAYLNFYLNATDNPWDYFEKDIAYSNLWRRDWYGFKGTYTTWSTWHGSDGWWKNQSYLKDKFDVKLSPSLTYVKDDVKVYREYFDGTTLSVQELVPENKSAITQKQIDKVGCFKANKNLKYLFLEELSDGSFKLKKGIDLDKIKDETYPRLSEFTLTQDDINDIVKFVKKRQKKEGETLIHFGPQKGSYHPVDTISEVVIEFRGDTLMYRPHVSPSMKGTYLRMVTPEKSEVLYKFDRDSHKLQPYMYIACNDTVFASEDTKLEYYTDFQADVQEDDGPSWYSRLWNWICDLCSSIGSWFANLF